MVRHGQTLANAKGIVQSCERGGGGGLTLNGSQQAQAAGVRLANEKFGFCVVSDAQRTIHTAELLLSKVPAARAALRADEAVDREHNDMMRIPFVHFDSLARERDAGQFAGKPNSTMAAAAREVVSGNSADDPSRSASIKKKKKKKRKSGNRRRVAADFDDDVDDCDGDERKERDMSAEQRSREWRPQGGESWLDVAERTRLMLRKVLQIAALRQEALSWQKEQHSCGKRSGRVAISHDVPDTSIMPSGSNSDHVLLVTHGGFIKEFINAHEKRWQLQNDFKNAPGFGPSHTAAAAVAAGGEQVPGPRALYRNIARNGSSYVFTVKLNAASAGTLRRAARAVVHNTAAYETTKNAASDNDNIIGNTSSSQTKSKSSKSTNKSRSAQNDGEALAALHVSHATLLDAARDATGPSSCTVTMIKENQVGEPTPNGAATSGNKNEEAEIPLQVLGAAWARANEQHLGCDLLTPPPGFLSSSRLRKDTRSQSEKIRKVRGPGKGVMDEQSMKDEAHERERLMVEKRGREFASTYCRSLEEKLRLRAGLLEPTELSMSNIDTGLALSSHVEGGSSPSLVPSNPTVFGDRYVKEVTEREMACAMLWCVHLPRIIMLASIASMAIGVYILAANRTSRTNVQKAVLMIAAGLSVWVFYVAIWGFPCRRLNKTVAAHSGDDLREVAYGNRQFGPHGKLLRDSAKWAERMRKYRINKPPLGYL
eukprot:g2722.t1